VNPGIAIGEQLALLGTIDPASQAAGTYSTAAFDPDLFRRLFIVINAGSIGSGDSLTITVTNSTTSGGSYTAVTGLASFPAITVTGNKAIYEIRTEFLQGLGVGPFYKVNAVLTGSNNSVFAVEVWGSLGRYGPASDYNLAAIQSATYN
jgi:hypothetical protein